MKILVFAYACRPGAGSEPEAGWLWSHVLAHFGEVWVITRSENANAVEAALAGDSAQSRLHFVYVDPPHMSLRRRDSIAPGRHYLPWQFAALRQARRLDVSHEFDVVWHLTYANAWIGSLASLLRRPFFYGPVGGCVTVPWKLLPTTGLKGGVREIQRTLLRRAARLLNPIARISWHRASLILANNEETRNWFPRRHRHKVEILQHTVLDHVPPSESHGISQGHVALFAGRLLPWKGCALAIRAVAASPGWRLLVCGSGPDRQRLERLAGRLGLQQRVTFLGEQPRNEIIRLMRFEAVALLFPSLHDDAPWVVAEAITAGLPVICLDRGGPPLLTGRDGGHIVPVAGSSAVVRDLSGCLDLSLCTRPVQVPSPDIGRFSSPARLEELSEILKRRFDAMFLEEPATSPVARKASDILRLG